MAGMVLATLALACTSAPGQPGAEVVLEQPTAAAAGLGAWEALDFSPAGVSGAEAVWTGSEVLVFERPDPEPQDARVVHLDPESGATTEAGIRDGSIVGSITMHWTWTGGELLVWSLLSDGASSLRGAGEAYDPASGNWRRFETVPVQTAFQGEGTGVAGVWTGGELLAWSHGIAFDPVGGTTRVTSQPPLASRHGPPVVWGGTDVYAFNGEHLIDGAAYDLASDVWTELPESPLAPRDRPSVVWTGPAGGQAGQPAGSSRSGEVLVWGGHRDPAQAGAYGAAYDPVAGTWRTLAEAPIRERSGAAIVWSGTEMLVWGGVAADGTSLDDGAAYDPATDTWRTLPPSPLAGDQPLSAVWTGEAMVVIGGCCGGGGSAVYRPAGAAPAPAEAAPAPSEAAGTAPGVRPATPPATMQQPLEPAATMSEGGPPATSAETATAVAIPEVVPSPVPAAGPILAHGWDDGLVELDPRSGEVVRRLPVDTGEGTAPLSVHPGGDAVYLSRAATACRAELVSMPLDGGGEEILGHGAWPAVSPDGSRLAFLRTEDCNSQDTVPWVRDLDTGEERPVPGGGEPNLFGPPAWSPDGRTLAVASVLLDPSTGARAAEDRVILLPADPPLRDRVSLESLEPGRSWTTPAWAGSDLLVVELCCDVIDGRSDVESSRVLAVDPQTGEVRRTILEVAGLVTWLETDAAGEQALLVSTAEEPGGSQDDQLLVLDLASGATRPLRQGIITASW